MQAALEISNLRKTYSNGFTALKGINLTVADGDFFALLGPNGAGKSTAIGIISSLVNKSDGSVSIYSHNIDTDFSIAKAQLGVVPQEFNFSIFETPMQVVMNQAGYYGIDRTTATQRAQKYLTLLGLWDKRNNQNRMLSGGMKRRLMIARALIHEPRLLILDEPTAGVDIEIRHSMWEFLSDLNNTGTTIILTTHYLEEAESLCRNIAIIDGGELVENTSMRDLLKRSNREIFVLDTETPMKYYPEGMSNVTAKDESTLEVEILKGGNLSEVIMALSKQGFTITSMRNKSNRLEQLFIDLVNDGHKNTGDSRE
jgi:ABC-2 type transport system ATP-binding protein